jgi:photosystem II stability/assembly factor-like uncharacterized protein
MTTTQVLVGTRKGAWIYTSDDSRQQWRLSPPIMPGYTVHHMAVDTRRATPRLFMAANHWAWGPGVAYSDDLGKTWTETREGLKFPEDMSIALGSVWNIRPGHSDQPGVVYAGTQPAGLFKSTDWGETWAPVDSINRHEYRPFFTMSGGGDSTLHTIEIDPRDPAHWYVSIATGGTFETNDDGQTWVLCSHRAIPTNAMQKQMWDDFAQRYPHLQEQFADFRSARRRSAAVNEMHKMRMDAANPDRLWAQTHVGVFTSPDGGNSWEDVTVGLPSFHGFPIGVSRSGDGAAYVVPLGSSPTTSAWSAASSPSGARRTTEKPGSNSARCFPVPTTTRASTARAWTRTASHRGVYVGTTNGAVFASIDGGDHWSRLPGTLPPILSVTAATW